MKMLNKILFNLKNKNEKAISKFIPMFLIKKIYSVYLHTFLFKVKKIFYNAKEDPKWLSWVELLEIHRSFPTQKVPKYDENSVKKRAFRKANQILSIIEKYSLNVNKILELGCNKGLELKELHNKGYKTTGIDIYTENFDENAIKQGVNLLEMNASDLLFEDNSFDFIYSFNSFEHFLDPEAVLKESLRVLKQGGYLYLMFAPLYHSAWGMHAKRSISIPYAQHLFPIRLIREAHKYFENLKPLGNSQLNKWEIHQYRNLWKNYSNHFKIIKYEENRDLENLNLIKKYPSCFKSKVLSFESLIINKIEILLKKR